MARSPHAGRDVPTLFPQGIVADRFSIRGIAGVGGTATVFEAADLDAGGRIVALKAIPKDETLTRRARRELRVGRELEHAAIVRLLDVVEDEDYTYVVFEHVQGRDLVSAFRSGELTDAQIMRAVAAVCDALAYAHTKGVVHRDVKPGNVLLREDGVPKLTDFGIAHLDAPDATLDDRLLGTLSYMAPEQVLGKPTDDKVDVWAAALMLYEALVGQNPYRAKTPKDLISLHDRRVRLSEARPDMPAGVKRQIDAALDPKPSARPTARQLHDALLAGARALDARSDSTIATAALPETPVSNGQGRLARLLRRPDSPPVPPALRLLPKLGTPAATPTASRADRLREQVQDVALRLQLGGRPEDPDEVARSAALDEDAPLGARPGLLAGTPAERLVPGLVAGAAAAVGTGALAFYPWWWPYLIGLVLGIVAVRRPGTASLLLAFLLLPLAGNVALGLVPLVAGVLALYLLCVRGSRIAALPVLAVVAAPLGLWPLYLGLCGRARRAETRFAAGAMGGLATVVAAGIGGRSTPLLGDVPGTGLTTRLAESHDVVGVASAVLAHGGVAALAVSLAWGLLAVAAGPAYELAGDRLRWWCALWLAIAMPLAVFAPRLAGAQPAPFLPAAVAVLLAAILVGVRSVLPGTAGERVRFVGR